MCRIVIIDCLIRQEIQRQEGKQKKQYKNQRKIEKNRNHRGTRKITEKNQKGTRGGGPQRRPVGAVVGFDFADFSTILFRPSNGEFEQKSGKIK